MNAKETLETLAIAIIGNVVSDRITKAIDARAKEKEPKPASRPKHMRDKDSE